MRAHRPTGLVGFHHAQFHQRLIQGIQFITRTHDQQPAKQALIDDDAHAVPDRAETEHDDHAAQQAGRRAHPGREGGAGEQQGKQRDKAARAQHRHDDVER
jgi:hypothetical protein